MRLRDFFSRILVKLGIRRKPFIDRLYEAWEDDSRFHEQMPHGPDA